MANFVLERDPSPDNEGPYYVPKGYFEAIERHEKQSAWIAMVVLLFVGMVCVAAVLLIHG